MANYLSTTNLGESVLGGCGEIELDISCPVSGSVDSNAPVRPTTGQVWPRIADRILPGS